jgi:hypothetical protein
MQVAVATISEKNQMEIIFAYLSISNYHGRANYHDRANHNSGGGGG